MEKATLAIQHRAFIHLTCLQCGIMVAVYLLCSLGVPSISGWEYLLGLRRVLDTRLFIPSMSHSSFPLPS